MSFSVRMPSPKLVLAGVLGLAVLTAVGVLAWSNWFRDKSEPVSVQEALRRFRARSAGAATQQPRLPAAGVYVYTINGSETLNSVISSSTHHYDGGSTVTIEPSRCGARERWQVLTTRWSESRLCDVHGRLQVKLVSEHHSFLGTDSDAVYACHGPDQPPTSDYRVGIKWVIACHGVDGSLRLESTVVAARQLNAASHRVAAVEISSRAVFNGEVSGLSRQKDWRRRSDGLLLRRRVSTQAEVDVLGGSGYSEQYSMQLGADSPRR